MTRFALAAVLVLLSAAASHASGRLALVFGNGMYQSIGALENPTADANLMAEQLEASGFEVMLFTEATQLEMKRGIVQFGRRLRSMGSSATGLFYYAGHAVQVDGRNFLLPVESEIIDPADLDIVGVETQWVLQQMHSARNETNVVILDACRDNPFEGTVAGFNTTGLAEMNAPTGTFISYATAPGGVAADGIGANSPYTAALVKAMATPGISIEETFKQVRIDVREATGGLQTPWDSSSLTKDFSFLEEAPRTAEDIAQEQLWNSVKATRDPVQIVLFLRAHPESPFEDEARLLLAETIRGELPETAAAPAAPAAKPAPAVPAPAAPEPVAKPTPPSAEENRLIANAQQTGELVAYQAYLSAYPEGAFAELAKAEVAALEAKAAAAPAPVVEPDAADEAPTEVAALSPGRHMDPTAPVTFDTPLPMGDDWVAGRSISELILESPLHPPIEGLPEPLWKNQSCSNCHQWNRARLCEQSQVYLKDTATVALAKPHPFGGSFKENLKLWATAGCL